MARWVVKEFTIIGDNENRLARRERQARELEHNQQALRESIAQSKRLADEADAMINRHREECDAAGGGK